MRSNVKPLRRGTRVYAGLSGGVDSSVAAALLAKEGADVSGVFIKGWYPPGLPCTWAEDRRDAMRVAAHLGIPFHTLDASDEYRKGVIDYLIREYREGRTPNPDVMCNREVKFGSFLRLMEEKGRERIATGHYARTEEGKLYRALNAAKDQSYFLWAVPQAALRSVVFPLGEYADKADVRALAKRLGLPNAGKRDSQGICFLGAVSVDEFLRAELGTEEGAAIDANGKEVGKHDGAVLRTLGERVSLVGATPGPWYVVRKDLETNQLIVAHHRSAPETRLRIVADNWFSEPNTRMDAQFRYHGPQVVGTYDDESKTFVPDEPLPEPAAPGQSLVFYRGDECIGGGIIS